MRHSQAGVASRLARTGAFALLLAAFTAVTAVSVPASAADYKPEYKLSTVVGEAFPWGFGGKRWAELVREKTEGRINVKMYPGAALVGGDPTRPRNSPHSARVASTSPSARPSTGRRRLRS
jgi:TRAP-type transport system periplasmic protein